MKCIDCPDSRFVQDEKGVVDLICFKFKRTVIATTVCIDSERAKKEAEVKKVYYENYQKYPLRDIAKMVGWSVNKLNYFVMANFLPRNKIRKRKEEKL